MAKRHPRMADAVPAEIASPVAASDDACELPPGWAMATLGEILRVSPEKVEPSDNPDASYVGLEHIESGTRRVLGAGKAGEVRSTKNVFRPGDILYGKLRPYLNKVARPDFGGVCSTDILVLQPSAASDARFAGRFLGTPRFVEFAMANSAGINLPRASFSKLADFPLALPPVAEQRRIVERLEALEARSRRAHAALDALPPLLAKARQSLLAAAFRGDLTADWRAENSTAECASKLKARLADARFTAWKKRRERYRQDVDAKHYGVPTPPTEEFVFNIPDEWELVSFDELTTLITSGSRDWKRHYRADGAGTFIMAQNIRPLLPDFSTRQRVSPPDDRDRDRSQVEEGDILATIVGANTGDVCRVPCPLPEHYVCQSVALMRPVFREMSEFLNYYMNADRHGQWQFREWMYGEGRPHLSFDHLRETAVVLPPLAEQHEIVRRLEAAFARLDATVAAHAAAAAELDRLDQALLAKAFRGELVAQDPAEEPAAVTLQRLRTPREEFDPFAYLFQFIPALLHASEGALPFVRVLEGCALLRVPRDLVRLLEPLGGAAARQHFERFAQPLKDGSFEPVLRKLISAGAITHEPRAGHTLRLVEAKAPPIAPLIAEDARHVASALALVPAEALETVAPRHTRSLCPKAPATVFAAA